MSYFYSILYIAILSSSLFAMDEKSGTSNPQNLISCHMESKVWGGHVNKKEGTTSITYQYADHSRSTYTTDNKKK